MIPRMSGEGRSPFVGRVRELERLRAAWADVQGGRSRTILLGGEAGIGKTRLLDMLGDEIRATGGLVVRGGSPASAEGALPFAAIVALFRAVARQLDAAEAERVTGPSGAALALLLPALRDQAAGDEPDGRMALFEAVLAAVERLAEVKGPSMLVVEDLQWADRSTRDLFGYLVHSLRDVEILLVGTYRSDGLAPGHPLRVQLAELDRLEGVERIDLVRLGGPEVAQMAAAVLGSGVGPDVVRRVVERSDGNPYFAEEILRALDEGREDYPPTLRELLAARLAGIPPALDQLVRMCAAIGGRFDQRILEGVIAAAPAELGSALRDCVARGLLTFEREGDRDVLAFRQTLLRQEAYDGLVRAERRRIHEAVARTLEQHPDYVPGPRALVDGEIARHWVQAEVARPARDALIRAGTSAEAAFAFPEAAAAFERALGVWDAAERDVDAGGDHEPIGFRPERVGEPAPHGPSRIDIVRRAADANSLAGRPDRALALVEPLLGTAGLPEGDAADWLRCGRYAWETGDLPRALEALDTAGALAGQDGRLAARVASARAGALIAAGRYAEARAAADHAITAATSAGSTSIARTARGLRGVAMAMEGDLEQGLAELSTARATDAAARAASVVMPRPSRIGEVVRGVEGYARVLERAGRPTLLAETVREGADLARRLGVEETFGGRVGAIQARSAFMTGDWDGADTATLALLDRAPDAETAARVHTVRAQLATGRGAFDDAAVHLAFAREAAVRVADPAVHADIAAALADLATWRRQLSEARDVVDAAVRRLHGAEDRIPIIPLAWLGLRAEADRAEVARATRDGRETAEAVAVGTALHAEVRALTKRLADRTAAAPRELRAISALAEAEFGRLEGRGDPAAWESALLRANDARDPWLAAYAGWREAEARLSGRGDRDRAELALRAAMERANRLGAAPLRDEMLAFARRARISLDAADAPLPDASEAAVRSALGLSERELEVLGLVAEGYTNRRIGEALFITEKTAGHHVSNVLGKLGVASRVEAAALAHRVGLLAVLPPAS